ncbi:MAG: protein-glutamate O-methyltransferase CheR [Pseudomonadota bacterium]
MIQMTDRQFQALADIARREAGLDFPPTKKVFVAARLQKRLRAAHLSDVDAYLDLARRPDPDGVREREDLICALTTNVTSVWREPHHFKLLADGLRHLVPPNTPRTAPIRIWSAGCASGAEILSIAATCRAVIGVNWAKSVSILGTDVDRHILTECAARLEASALADLADGAPVAIDPGWRWTGALSVAVSLQRHNLLTPPPSLSYFDMVFCRNVTIYFDRVCQETAHRNLIKSLRPGAFLFLGHSERLLDTGRSLTPIGRTAFRAIERPDGRSSQ